MKWIIIGEYLLASILVSTLLALIYTQKYKTVTLLYVCAIFLSSIWEFAHYVAGPNFIDTNCEIKQYICDEVYALLHCLIDGLIFLVITGLVYLLYRVCKGHSWALNKLATFSCVTLFLYVFFGITQEIIVEVLCQNRVWKYKSSKINPVVFKIKNREFTLIPFVEWIIFPIIYFIISTLIFQTNNSR